MDNELISLAPGGILMDGFGDPQAPTFRPVPILPGLCFSAKGRGQIAVDPAIMPRARGALRVPFLHQFPPPGFLYLVAGGGQAPSTVVVLCFDDGSVVALHSPDGLMLDWAVATTGPVPEGQHVTLTVAWDAENPLDNGFYVKGQIEGYDIPVANVLGGGDVPFAPFIWDNVIIATDAPSNPAVLPLPTLPGRVQVSTLPR